MKGPDVDKVTSKLDRNLKTHLDFLESQITSSPDGGLYMCGKTLSAADIMLSFPLMVIELAMGGIKQYPGLEAYVGLLKELPSCQSAIVKAESASGEKYKLL